MEYSERERNTIRDLSFYTTLDFLDELNNFQNAQRCMEHERGKYLTKFGGLEKWIKLRDRPPDENSYYGWELLD